jgi:hypothetical protein
MILIARKYVSKLETRYLISLGDVPDAWDSSVCIVTRLQAGQERSYSLILGGAKYFLFAVQPSDWFSGSQIPLFCGYRGIFPRGKAAGT